MTGDRAIYIHRLNLCDAPEDRDVRNALRLFYRICRKAGYTRGNANRMTIGAAMVNDFAVDRVLVAEPDERTLDAMRVYQRWFDAEASLISHTSGDITGDILAMYARVQAAMRWDGADAAALELPDWLVLDDDDPA